MFSQFGCRTVFDWPVKEQRQQRRLEEMQRTHDMDKEKTRRQQVQNNMVEHAEKTAERCKLQRFYDEWKQKLMEEEIKKEEQKAAEAKAAHEEWVKKTHALLRHDPKKKHEKFFDRAETLLRARKEEERKFNEEMKQRLWRSEEESIRLAEAKLATLKAVGMNDEILISKAKSKEREAKIEEVFHKMQIISYVKDETKRQEQLKKELEMKKAIKASLDNQRDVLAHSLKKAKEESIAERRRCEANARTAKEDELIRIDKESAAKRAARNELDIFLKQQTEQKQKEKEELAELEKMEIATAEANEEVIQKAKGAYDRLRRHNADLSRQHAIGEKCRIEREQKYIDKAYFEAQLRETQKKDSEERSKEMWRREQQLNCCKVLQEQRQEKIAKKEAARAEKENEARQAKLQYEKFLQDKNEEKKKRAEARMAFTESLREQMKQHQEMVSAEKAEREANSLKDEEDRQYLAKCLLIEEKKITENEEAIREKRIKKCEELLNSLSSGTAKKALAAIPVTVNFGTNIKNTQLN